MALPLSLIDTLTDLVGYLERAGDATSVLAVRAELNDLRRRPTPAPLWNTKGSVPTASVKEVATSEDVKAAQSAGAEVSQAVEGIESSLKDNPPAEFESSVFPLLPASPHLPRFTVVSKENQLFVPRAVVALGRILLDWVYLSL
jgi:hypothetical protein